MLNQLPDLISPNKFNTCPPSEVRGILARSSEIFNRYPPNLDIQLDHAQTWFNLTLQQREADISATVTDIVDFLRSNPNIIPQFKEALADYLCTHSDHKVRYKPLLLPIKVYY